MVWSAAAWFVGASWCVRLLVPALPVLAGTVSVMTVRPCLYTYLLFFVLLMWGGVAGAECLEDTGDAFENGLARLVPDGIPCLRPTAFHALSSWPRGLPATPHVPRQVALRPRSLPSLSIPACALRTRHRLHWVRCSQVAPRQDDLTRLACRMDRQLSNQALPPLANTPRGIRPQREESAQTKNRLIKTFFA